VFPKRWKLRHTLFVCGVSGFIVFGPGGALVFIAVAVYIHEWEETRLPLKEYIARREGTTQ
jgi:hypothetical protein